MSSANELILLNNWLRASCGLLQKKTENLQRIITMKTLFLVILSFVLYFAQASTNCSVDDSDKEVKPSILFAL